MPDGHMIDVVEQAFWLTATKLVDLIVPLIVIWVTFKIISSLFFTDRA